MADPSSAFHSLARCRRSRWFERKELECDAKKNPLSLSHERPDFFTGENRTTETCSMAAMPGDVCIEVVR